MYSPTRKSIAFTSNPQPSSAPAPLSPPVGMEDTERWACKVVRAHGLHFMRPEKSWRPIVTVEVDKTQQHETVLGSDGQNINLKASFLLKDATLSSRVEVKVFHRSQSKKKGKKRILVGSAGCSLRELWNKHGTEPKLRLQCQTPTKRSIASRGRPQNGAIIHLRLYPPTSVVSQRSRSPSAGGYCSTSSRSSSPSDDSETLNDHASVSERIPAQSIRKRRRVRPYSMNSDDPESYSEEYDSDEDTKPLFGGPLFDDDDGKDDVELQPPRSPIKISFNPMQWLAPLPLPQYTVSIPVPPLDEDMHFFERAISIFTVYVELRRARCDNDFERIFKRLQSEWSWNATILMALAGVNITIFTLSPDSLFAINSMSKSVVAASSIASGLGVICSIWFLFWYAWVDLDTFISRTQDVMSTPTAPSYFFFSVSARLPSLLTLTSSMALMLFLAFVAYSVWPLAVIIGCFLVGLLLGLQFLVFAVVWFYKTARTGFKALASVFVRNDADADAGDENEKH